MDVLINRRKLNSNKGDFGRICVIGGSKGMCGSVYLASMSALRCGSGLVYTIVPEVISNIMQIKSIENIVLSLSCKNDKLSEDIFEEITQYLKNKDAFCIGCGMGQDDLNFELIKYISKNFKKPLIIDADGLNSIKGFENIKHEDYNLVITPHPLEFKRLSGYEVDYINKNRVKLSCEFSKQHKCIVVLKGNKTVVAKGDSYYINETGGPALATAGSGDCLSGIITSFSKGRTLFDACKLGVYVHGLAGDIAEKYLGEDSVIASDIIKFLPDAIRLCKEK